MRDYSQSSYPFKGITLTPKFNCELYPYQSEAIEWMMHRENTVWENVRGGFLLLDMGLGKTLCGLGCAILSGGRTLVVAPAQLVYVWEAEIKGHFKDVSYFLYYGTNRVQRLNKYVLEHGDPMIIVTSYQSAASYMYNDDEPLRDIPFDRIIFDECQYIKNHSTRTFGAVEMLRSPIKWFLSGTPIMNSIREMYPYLRLLHYSRLATVPNVRRDRRVARRQARRFHDSSVNQAVYMDMQDLLTKIAFRRTKEVLNLPSKQFHNIIVPMTSCESSFQCKLKEYAKSRLNRLLNNLTLIRFSGMDPRVQSQLRMIIIQSLLVLLLDLRLSCCDPSLVVDKIPRTKGLSIVAATEAFSVELGSSIDCKVCYNDKVTMTNVTCGHSVCETCFEKLGRLEPMICFECLDETDKHEWTPLVGDHDVSDKLHEYENRLFFDSSKTQCVLYKMEDELENGNKVVVCSQWVTYLDKLVTSFKARCPNVEFIVLNGSVAPQKRQQLVSKFQNDPSVQVCFASLTSSAKGITLTASNVAILADPYWNMAKLHQFSDRVHRIGQKKEVNVYSVLMKDSIELKIQELAQRKDIICRVVVDCQPITEDTESWLKKIVKLLE